MSQNKQAVTPSIDDDPVKKEDLEMLSVNWLLFARRSY